MMTSADKQSVMDRISGVGLVSPHLEGNKPDTVRDINIITSEILDAQRAGGQAIIDIGNRLIEAKAMLNHGEWLPWLADKVGYSESTAQNFMRLARKYTNPQLVGDLGMRKALALLALPDSEREGFVAENNVIDMSSRELEKAIKERDEARKAAEQAQADARSAQDARASMEESLKTAQELLDSARLDVDETRARESALQAQLKKLRDAPVEVAVMQVDQERLDQARAEGEAAKAKEIAQLQAQLDKAQEAKKKADEKRKDAEAAVDTLKLQLEESTKAKEKAAAMADPDVAKFEVYFNQAQEVVNKLRGLLLKARGREDQTTAEKLSKAILALSDAVKGAAQ